jgi:hypothetical protein
MGRAGGWGACGNAGVASGEAAIVRHVTPGRSTSRLLESGDPVDYADYSRAGHFVAFLLETHGFEPMVRFAQLPDFDDGYSKVRGGCADATVVWVSTQAPLEQVELPPGQPFAYDLGK